MTTPSDRLLQDVVADRLAQLVRPGARCLVAVSGGPDSLALLDLLHLGAARHGRQLGVAHVDHGIHPDSAIVAAAVATAAHARGLTFHRRDIRLPAGVSETKARSARRAALLEIAWEWSADAVLLAHHADDQAETVMLRLLRGTGPAGLAAMSARTGVWVRPLLEVRRRELATHLASRGLSAWADPANSDPRHLRSWLRTEVLPIVSARLPDVVERLVRSASQAADARAAWQEALVALPALELRTKSGGISVAAPVLQGYRSALRHAILAAIGRRAGVLIGARRLAELDRLLASQSGCGAVSLARRYRAELAFGRLTLYQPEGIRTAVVSLMPGQWVNTGAAKFGVSVGPADAPRRSGWSTSFPPGEYAARGWTRGDRICPLGGTGSRAVAVLMREARIPPARRATWPVVVNAVDATIVWVPGICRANAEVPPEGTEAWRVECTVA